MRCAHCSNNEILFEWVPGPTYLVQRLWDPGGPSYTSRSSIPTDPEKLGQLKSHQDYCKDRRISTRECTWIFGFGSYPLKFTYEIPSKFHLRFPPIFMPRATKFPSFISLHHKYQNHLTSIKMSDDSDSDFGFGSSPPFLDDDEPSTTTQESVKSTTTQESVVDGACGRQQWQQED